MAADAERTTVGLIQDAALDPTRWPTVIEHMMQQLDAVAGSLVVSDRQGGFTLAAPGFDPSYVAQYFGHYVNLDPMLWAQHHMAVGRAVISSTLMPDGAFRKSEFFNDWYAPQGFHDCFSAIVHRQGEQQTRLHIVPRRRAARDMSRFARLLPSMVRALRVAQRLDLLSDQQCALQDVLLAVTHAVMAFDHHGCLVFANPPAEKLFGSTGPLMVKNGRLMARDAADDVVLQAALTRSLRMDNHDHDVVHEIAVRRPKRRPLMMSVVPVSRRVTDHADSDPQLAAMIVAVDCEVRPWSRLEGFVRAYGLTPAEGRVLDIVVDGDGLDRAADSLGVGRATVKTHLNRIFAKTGTTRQAELIRLVAGSLPPLRA